MPHTPSRWLWLAPLLLTACAMPTKPDGADSARAALEQLKSQQSLAAQVPVEMQLAESAVQLAETPTTDAEAGQQAVYVAQRRIELARLQAERQQAEAQVKALQDERVTIRLDAQSRATEVARQQVAQAATLARQQEEAAARARDDAQAAELQAQAARAQADALQAQMRDLQAQATDRGMVMTLGDVLFASGHAALKPSAGPRLDKLAAFMTQYPDRRLTIEGYTDDRGSDSFNLALSQQRADAVKAYLILHGVDDGRIGTVGRGKDSPVADNGTADGRQQNRRVEVVIYSATAPAAPSAAATAPSP